MSWCPRRSKSGSPAITGSDPDFCEAADPESKGIVENLVGYAKADLMMPQAPFGGCAAANEAAAAWCAEVNGVTHSEICAVPTERLMTERELLAPLPSLRAGIGKFVTRRVDRLSCVRFASARYSVPVRLIGTEVRTGGCWSSSPGPGRSSPRTPWLRRARPRSAMSITAGRGRTPRSGRSDPRSGHPGAGGQDRPDVSGPPPAERDRPG